MDWSTIGRLFCLFFLVLEIDSQSNTVNSAWRWECQNGHCRKERITPETNSTALSLAACRLFCSKYAGIFPQPTGQVKIGNYLLQLNVNSIDVSGGENTPIADLVKAAAKHFKGNIAKITPKIVNTVGGRSLIVTLKIADPKITQVTLGVDESYSLNVEETKDGRVNATITAKTFFGGRHGLETLSQLIIHDDLRGEVQIVRDFTVDDKPIYTHRGILLDTSRNYISVDSIKRTIAAMGASKLNVFHWHITDSHSFPYVSKSQPKLSQLGAYAPNKIYSPQDVADIVQWGKEHGVKVMPEFDAPAHVGEGWQDTDFIACFNKQPWSQYCVEPPCGQLNPTKDKLYDALEGIYSDMVEQFTPDVFHMGGDEVSLSCWNSTANIVKWMANQGWGRTEADFMKLWNVFQTKALERVYKKTGKPIPIIMWTSTLTKIEYVEKYLPKDTYIIQIWTLGRDSQIPDLLNRGYRLILSNYDAYYLDCGFAGWVTDGNNWCSPYIGWQKVYENSPAKLGGNKADQILGAESALWTEQADDSSVDNRLWPRAAAMAERLWAEPKTSWRDAEGRMLVHRERLVTRGISSDTLEPEWCLQNEGDCPI